MARPVSLILAWKSSPTPLRQSLLRTAQTPAPTSYELTLVGSLLKSSALNNSAASTCATNQRSTYTHLPDYATRYDSDSSAYTPWLIGHFKLYTGKMPYYPQHSDFAVMHGVLEGMRPERPLTDTTQDDLADHIWDCMQACWAHKPLERPTIREVIARFNQAELQVFLMFISGPDYLNRG